MGWWKWRVHVDKQATERNHARVLQYCQDVNCPEDHHGYEPFKGMHEKVLDKWDFLRDSDGKVGK